MLLRGYLTDLTRVRRDEVQPAVESAIDEVLVHRAVIERAKGLIMGVCGLDADTAFDRLREASSRSNAKLHAVADRVLELAGATAPGRATDEWLEDVLRQATERP